MKPMKSTEQTKIKWEDNKDELYTFFGKCECGADSIIIGSKYCNECGKEIINPRD